MAAEIYLFGGRFPVQRSVAIALVLAIAGSFGMLLHESQSSGEILVGMLVIVALLWNADPARVVALSIGFLPVQDLVIAHVPHQLALLARYLPEILVDVLALILVFRRPGRLGSSGRLGAAILLTMFFFVLTGVWRLLSPTVIATGLRSEFRFLAIAVAVLYFRRPIHDIRLVARVLLYFSVLESVIAVLEVVGGPSVRGFFAPSYKLVVGGVVVGDVGPPLDTIFGTFPHRNDLGAFLAFAWAVLAAAGVHGLGISRRALAFSLVLVGAGVLLSGSREGSGALVVAALIIGGWKLRLPLVRVGIAAAVALATFAAVVPPQPNARQYIIDQNGNVYVYLHSSSLVSRWQSVLSKEAWTPSYYTNFRLYFLVSNVKLVAKRAPLFGYGIGSVSDPARLSSPSNPALLTAAGQDAVAQGFVYDGNWALLALEVGLGGLAVLGALLASLFAAGMRCAADHWSGIGLAACAAGVAVLGFFAPTLQHRGPTAILWLLVGVVMLTGRGLRSA